MSTAHIYNHLSHPVLSRFVLPIGIIAIGSLNLLGYTLHAPSLQLVGYATAAAPLPLPFSDIRGRQESFSYAHTIRVYDDNNAYQLTARSSILTGSHKYKIAFMSAVMRASTNDPLNRSVAKYLFCETPDQLQQFPFSPDDEYVVSIILSHINEDDVMAPAIICAD